MEAGAEEQLEEQRYNEAVGKLAEAEKALEAARAELVAAYLAWGKAQARKARILAGGDPETS